MIKILFSVAFLIYFNDAISQTNPVITSWNIDSIRTNTYETSIEQVQFSANWVYIITKKSSNEVYSIYKIPIHPEKANESINTDFNYKGIFVDGEKISGNYLPHYSNDSTKHSSIIGFANDGFPVYGPFGYTTTNGTGPIARMESAYHLRKIKKRKLIIDGKKIKYGPRISKRNPLGKYEKDYEFTLNSNPVFLDEHNGRFCITPEYPVGNYCYFVSLDKDGKMKYPYSIGPSYYGKCSGNKIDSIDEITLIYAGFKSYKSNNKNKLDNIKVFFAEKSQLIVIQNTGLLTENITLQLYNSNGIFLKETNLLQGSTIAYFDTQTLYNGHYKVKVISSSYSYDEEVIINKQD